MDNLDGKMRYIQCDIFKLYIFGRKLAIVSYLSTHFYFVRQNRYLYVILFSFIHGRFYLWELVEGQTVHIVADHII